MENPAKVYVSVTASFDAEGMLLAAGHHLGRRHAVSNRPDSRYPPLVCRQSRRPGRSLYGAFGRSLQLSFL